MALARARGGYDELAVGELTAFLRQHEQSYDLVVSADALVYCGDLGEFAAAAAGALQPGGALVFTLERAEPGEAEAGYRLNPHGRYSHTGAHVSAALTGSSLSLLQIEDQILRLEGGTPVHGLVIAAIRD